MEHKKLWNLGNEWKKIRSVVCRLLSSLSVTKKKPSFSWVLVKSGRDCLRVWKLRLVPINRESEKFQFYSIFCLILLFVIIIKKTEQHHFSRPTTKPVAMSIRRATFFSSHCTTVPLYHCTIHAAFFISMTATTDSFVVMTRLEKHRAATFWLVVLDSALQWGSLTDWLLLMMSSYFFFRISVYTSCHVHSSLSKPLPQNLFDFLPAGCPNRSEADVCVTLIWKEGWFNL